MSDPASTPSTPSPARGILSFPATSTGWWAFALEVAFVILFAASMAATSAGAQTALWGRLSLINQIMLVVTPVSLLLAIVGGVLAIVALARKGDRSLLVWFAAAVFVVALGVVVLSLV